MSRRAEAGKKAPRRRERRARSGLARRDMDALEALLDGVVDMVRRWSLASARGEHRLFPDVEGIDLAARLAEPLPRRGQSARNILARLEKDLLPFLRDNGHPGFMGYVMSPPSAVGIAGDLLASALDQNLTSWRSAPGATEIERLVVDWMRQIAGMPAGTGGLMTSGGSLANFIALAVARATHAPPATVRGGLGELGGRMMTLYASEEVHMSVPRAVQLLGLGTAALRLMPVDHRFRLDVAALERAMDADRKQGHLPFCIIASAGTVSTGAVDPLQRLSRLARQRGLWLHVDAAYGGPLALSPRHRSLVAGMSQADSVTLDPHKWLAAPLDAGCVLFRDAEAPLAAFSTRGDYAAILDENERRAFAFFDHGPELSRRFRALKVWMILKYHGVERLGRRLEDEMEIAAELATMAQNHDETELMAPAETSIVCFRYVPVALRLAGEAGAVDEAADGLNRDILLALQRGGRAYISSTRLQGRFVLRACVLNFRTTRKAVRDLFQEVLEQGRRLARERGWENPA